MTTKPHHCALAIAIPLNRDDFSAQLNSSSTDKDFVKNFARNSQLTEDVLWEDVYSPTVNIIQSVIRHVEAKGVTVVTNINLAKLQDLFQRFSVVTLIAHWRSSKFYPSDFLLPTQLIRSLEQPSDLLTQKLSDALSSALVAYTRLFNVTSNEPGELLELLARDFNNAIKNHTLYPEIVLDPHRKVAPYDDTYRMYLNRLAIDNAFAGVISSGNRIEFSDRFHSIEEVIATIPENYSGLLDFTVCNSVLIGNAIKRQRRCIVLVNEKLASPESRMIIYKGIIELLDRSDLNYMDAAVMIRRKILQ